MTATIPAAGLAADAATQTELDAALALAAPVGRIQIHPSTSPPANWLNCDGTTVSTTTYATLFAAIGTAFNSGGEPGGTFRLPNIAAPLTGTRFIIRAL